MHFGRELSWAVALAAASLCGCVDWVPYAGPKDVTASEPPDALYGAAVRVFVRRGWGFQARDPVARTIETSWIKYDGMKGVVLSHRIMVDRGHVQIFSSCMSSELGGPCKDGHRPAGTQEAEERVVAEIVAEARLMSASDRSAPPPSPKPVRSGESAKECVSVCGKDRDSCQRGCAKSTKCLDGCGTGYEACLKVCGG